MPNQLYPDLSQFLDSVFSSENRNGASQEEQERRQSIWRDVLNSFMSNFSQTPVNNSAENQQHPPSAPPPENTQESRQNSGTSHVPHGNTPHSRPDHNQNFNHYGSSNPQSGMPWNYEYRHYYNMRDGAYHDGANFDNWPNFQPLLSAFFLRCAQASARITVLLTLALLFFCLPQTLLAIGLAVAVIHSITRIPVSILIAASAFLCFLLYLDSQLLMILCVWATFKCIVMGKPLMNREYWRGFMHCSTH